EPLPPPLPRKQLQRAESLPEPAPPREDPREDPPARAGSTRVPNPPRHQEGAASTCLPRDRPCWGHKRPLTKSQSLGTPVARRGSVGPWGGPVEPTFTTPDAELGGLLQPPASGAGLCAVLLGAQRAALARLSARARDALLGQQERQRLLAAELAGKGWAGLRLLGPEPCCDAGDAWYFRVGPAAAQSPVVLAAKVLKSRSCSLTVQTSLGLHCSIQQVIGHFTDALPRELVLPRSTGRHRQARPGEEDTALLGSRRVLQVVLSPEVPYQTLADFVKESHQVHKSSPGHYERLACLLLLQVCAGLEHLKKQNAGHGDVCPENLLIVQCPCPPPSQQGKETSPGLSLPRLLISNFFKAKEKRRPCSTTQEQDWAEGFSAPASPLADELNVGMLIYTLLHVDISLENALGFGCNRLPEIPSLSIYSTGLKRLAALLLHRDPCKRVTVEEAKSILQVLLWGPRQELFARSERTPALLQSWVDLKRALLLLKFAEKTAGAGGSPTLEEWLCCQYFKEVTEHTLYQATQALYA
ncbi:PRAG1 kinase, partial [Eudromia elegans]|nr:PRAG1 kinase [Eudromia elegans]